MNNDELKKKIEEIVAMAMCEADELPFVETAEYIADELISAGIGDVKKAECRAIAAELVAKTAAEIGILKYEEMKHRAEVAERALDKATEFIRCKKIGKCEAFLAP